jgi:hypothetical protein
MNDYCKACHKLIMKPDVNYGINPDAVCVCPRPAFVSLQLGAGELDGQSLIDMNNLAVGFGFVYKLIALFLLSVGALSAQTVQIPYSGQAPYTGSMSVQVQVTGLPSGCSVGTPTYTAGVIAVTVNCGVVPPPVGTNCQSTSTPVAGCTIGSTVAVVSTPGNVRGTPTTGGGNGPLLGTQPAGTKGVILTNPIPQTAGTGKGWQVANFGTATCAAAGPYSATCGYIGNDNLAPSGVTPPPVTTCAKTLSPSGGVDNSALLAAISAAGGKCVELTAGTFNLTPFIPPSGTSLLLDDGVVIQDSGIFGRTTYFFTVQNSNVTIVTKGPLNNAIVRMPTNYANAQKEVATHCGTSACDYEYQHCFALVNGVSNITLSGFSLLNCGGDGLNFQNTSGATITNVNSATNIRQGMSVTGPATGITITGGNLHDGPLSALDVEPDSGISGNIQMVITNLQTNNNTGGGLSFGLMNLNSSNNVNIIATGIKSTGDGGTGIAYWNGSNTTAPTGTVKCINCSVTNSGADGVYGQRSSVGYQMIFQGLTITNSNSKQSSGPNQTNTALGLACNSCTGSAVPGGVQFSGVVINGGNGCFSFPSNSAAVTLSGTCNSKQISYP